MSHLFKPVHLRLSTDGRELTVEPVLSFGIGNNGWHTSGIYQIYNGQNAIGRIHFEGNQWDYEGSGLSETEQEELAYFIRFYDGEAA